MKKFLKVLGIAAVAAAVVPCKVEKDEETGVKTYQSLLSRLRIAPGEGGKGTSINVDALGGVLPAALGHNEADDYADEELDLETMETEPVFEVSFKVERDVPPAEAAEAAAKAAEEAQAAAEEAKAAADQARTVAEEHKIDL